MTSWFFEQTAHAEYLRWYSKSVSGFKNSSHVDQAVEIKLTLVPTVYEAPSLFSLLSC
jgi:hypothetical protein